MRSWHKVATRRATDLARSGVVLIGRGALDPRRPDHALRALIVARRVGPFAGVIAQGTHRHGGAVAVYDERGSMTFADIDSRSNALARALAERGIGSGDVVAALVS